MWMLILMPIAHLVDKFRRTSVVLGLWNTVLFAVSRVLDSATGSRFRLVRYYFVAQPVTLLSASDYSEISRTGPFTLSWVDADCPDFSQTERPASVLAARFAQGARCLMATYGAHKEFAGFIWFVIGSYDEDEVRARFMPQPVGQTSWDFDVSIAPRFRMSRLFSYLWRAANAEMSSLGVTCSFSRISAFNATSLTSHQRLGGFVMGKATFLCVGKLQLMISTLYPRLHISWCDRQRPEIKLASNYGVNVS